MRAMRRPAVQLLLSLATFAAVTGVCFAYGFNATSTSIPSGVRIAFA